MIDLSRLLQKTGKTSARDIITAIPGVIALLDEQGVNFRPQALRIVETLLPRVQDESLEQRILRLYDQLDRLDASEEPLQASYLLDQLRDLEQQEADQYAREFDAWRPLKEGALEAALDHAASLLKK